MSFSETEQPQGHAPDNPDNFSKAQQGFGKAQKVWGLPDKRGMNPVAAPGERQNAG